jgi:phospholipase/lecithinase/hemolysin
MLSLQLVSAIVYACLCMNSAFAQIAGLGSTPSSRKPGSRQGPRPGQIKNIITFGDSYTDVVNTGDGGVAWPVYAAGYANLTLFPFARSGATCSNNITFRPFPSVFESQIPDFLQQRKNATAPLRRINQKESIYTLWIGTNDVGSNALLTHPNNVSIVDTTRCAINWVKTMYAFGARNFIFQNVVVSCLLRSRLGSTDSILLRR